MKPADIGVRGQCVDYVRRYLIRHYGVYFTSVKNAANLVHVRSLYTVAEGKRMPWRSAPDITKGCVLVWTTPAPTGHVAVVTRVTPSFIEVAERNFRGDGAYGRRRLSPIAHGAARILACP